MHAFDVLGDPVRRRILDLLAEGERPAGAVVDVVAAEFGITQPAVSRHLRILREQGFAAVRAEGARRIYSLERAGVESAAAELDRYRRFWSNRLDALHTEVARERRARRKDA
ncbi:MULTISPECIES: helix-turn-helix transcriptional regulator [unclassified Agromyces]|uniref:ArsR/SmtB family transcription factor n=1 Tax=unclassified Agromyces TaxID=2639701 RepID=UPI0007B2534C|nr:MULTISPECIES: metalloregulator ArsR/SmtB family transcription factor [unclassified Agromyces]KZE95121.1 Transcriptional repressor SdpR [Agromyces sp. NDB4Y10]MCK8609986.1 metalloregulator ArsR/SmtB family transcription factor [Agromyces sp. C10]